MPRWNNYRRSGRSSYPHPSPAPEPAYPSAAPLPSASAGPTASSHEAGGDDNRAVGGGSTEPPPDLQCQHGITATRHLEDGGATQEGPGKSRDGGGLPAHRRHHTLPPAAYPPHRCGHGDGTHLPQQGHRRGGGLSEYFLFPDLSPSAGSEAALLTRKWDAILGGGTLTSFANTNPLLRNQKVAPIAGWYEAVSQLEAWAIVCMVFLGDDGFHPTTYDIFLLLEETSRVSLGIF